jgi:Domain of unknown function (DUF4249)
MMRIIFILSCVVLFLSCTKEAKVKLPETKPLPVMYSYICPTDTVIRLKLMSSSPLFSSNQIDILAAVPDGDVKISSAQGTAQLIFNQTTGYYELKTNLYPIVPGQVYKMTVTTINGDVATAETQVPLTTVPINTVTIETIPENYQTSDLIKVSFTDEPGRVNYYRMAALHAFAYPFQADTITDETRIKELYSDINHDGENVSMEGRFYQRYDSTEYFSTEYYDVFLYNCSESYYKFYKSLRTDLSGIGFPPPAEPTLQYSNVKGGFGCFGAYMKMTFRYKKK